MDEVTALDETAILPKIIKGHSQSIVFNNKLDSEFFRVYYYLLLFIEI